MWQEPPLKRQCHKRLKINNDPPNKGIDFTASLLSDEIILHIFSFLSPSDLVRCACVNSNWYRLTNDELLWKPLFLRRFREPLLQRLETLPGQKRKRLHGNQTNWKSMYKVSHNWRSGNCNITQLELNDKTSQNLTRKPHSFQPLVQFCYNFLCLANGVDTTVAVWQLVNDCAPRLIGQLRTSSINARQVSCLKIEASRTTKQDMRLVVGYDSGGFSLWEFGIHSDQFFSREVGLYERSSIAPAEHVISIGLCYPLLITCTADMKLSAFHVNTKTLSLEMIYELQSSVRWHPITVNLEPYDLPDARNGSDPHWKATLCFCMPGRLSTFSIGVQEIVLSSRTIISSRHCSAVNEEDYLFTSQTGTALDADDLHPITALSYSEPFLTTAHPNNTIQQYRVHSTKDHLEVVHVRTLYGHTCKVGALAINTSFGRLVSGDRCGIKIWDICSFDSKSGRDTDRLHGNGYPTLTWQSGGEYLVSVTNSQPPMQDIQWVQFDEDKIVAIILNYGQENGEPFSTVIRIWSFADAPPGLKKQ